MKAIFLSEETQKRLFDRKLQYVQFRIQQELVLVDEEIDRLSNRLKVYKSQIIAQKDKIQQLNSQIEEKKMSKDGEIKLRETNKNTNILKIKAGHFQQIQQMRQYFSTEIEQLQNEFNDALENINNKKNNEVKENYMLQMKSIQKEIDFVKSQIDSVKETKANIANQVDNNDENNDDIYYEVNNPVIAQLRNAIEVRMKERYDGLMDSKTRLNDFVIQLETMTRQHALQVDNLVDKINSMEYQFQSDIQHEQCRHSLKIADLKKELEVADQRLATLYKVSTRLKAENKRQIDQTTNELLQIKSEKLNSLTRGNNNDEYTNQNVHAQLKEINKDVMRLNRHLKVKEDELHQKRDENETLKREIGRLNHEIRFINRPKIGLKH